MIQNCDTEALGLLADTRVCGWYASFQGAEPVIMVDSAIIVKACHRTEFCVVLTHDGRILARTRPGSHLVDITSSLPDGLGQELLDDGTEIHVFTYTITIKTRCRVCFLDARPPNYGVYKEDEHINVVRAGSYTFPSGINLAGFGSGHGFVRTNDNYLYIIDSDSSHSKGCQLVDIADPEHIREIITDTWYTLLIMKDGTARTCGLFDNRSWFLRTSGSFVKIEFPDEVSVAKIINRKPQIFFITTEGQCYYVNADAPGLKPVLIGALVGYYVEDVFIAGRHVIVLHDGCKVCLLNLISSITETCTANMIDPNEMSGEKLPEPLLFCNDKGIISVQHVGVWIYFTTSEGHVYYHRSWTLTCDSHLREIPFFTDNPIMVESRAARIGSAANTLRGD